MDRQHARILEIAGRAKDPDLDEVGMQILIVELISYSEKHLEKEEEMLRENGLHEFLRDHVLLHREFREFAIQIYQDFRESDEVEKMRMHLGRVADFCENWLLTHIDIEDRKYANLLVKK